MKKYLLAATLIAAFAVPASAKPHYIMYNKATKTCSISKTAPSETKGVSGASRLAKSAVEGASK
jgi:hypothetical protein